MIDEIDREILSYLSRYGRATQREVGQAVGLSPNAAAARMARLQDQGVITGYAVVIDHERLGRSIEGSVDVWLRSDDHKDDFARVVAEDERIIEAFHPTGPLDYRIRVRVASTDDLADLISLLKEEGGVNQTDTRLVLVRLPVTS